MITDLLNLLFQLCILGLGIFCLVLLVQALLPLAMPVAIAVAVVGGGFLLVKGLGR